MSAVAASDDPRPTPDDDAPDMFPASVHSAALNAAAVMGQEGVPGLRGACLMMRKARQSAAAHWRAHHPKRHDRRRS